MHLVGLPQMTMEEHKFALAVERVVTMVSSPEYRQLLIEATHVLGTLMMHDVEKRVHLDCTLKVDEIVDTANILFLLDHVSLLFSFPTCLCSSYTCWSLQFVFLRPQDLIYLFISIPAF